MVKVQRYIAYILTSVIMVGLILLFPNLVDAISPTYLLIISAFLGFDVATAAKRTAKMGEGEFHPIQKDRYIVSFVLTCIVLGFSVFMNKVNGAPITGTISLLSISTMTIGAFFIAGLESVRMLTGVAPAPEVNTPTNTVSGTNS